MAFTALTVLALIPALGCGGSGIRSGVSVGPRLSSAQLGSLRSCMTYDGDWLGGVSSSVDLAADLELAARRGVDFVIDLRSDYSREVQPLDEAVASVGMELVVIPRGGAAEEGASDGGQLGLTSDAIDAVRRVLNAPGRRRSLLLDETGTISSVVYAIHLTVDEGIAEAEALRAARATGLSDEAAQFVRREVDRLRDGR